MPPSIYGYSVGTLNNILDNDIYRPVKLFIILSTLLWFSVEVD